jgi:hypothetical protein
MSDEIMKIFKNELGFVGLWSWAGPW